MAELLIVVAIIAVLGSVGFIAVQNHQRDMARLERDAVAREIFVAAQNHLTMADSQGYLGTAADKFGEVESAADNVYYYVVNKGDAFTAAGDTVLDYMLPFGAIDETVRAGGSYILRYQSSPARVLDVFYAEPDGRYPHSFTKEKYSDALALAGEGKRSSRLNWNGAVIGWYGGEAAVETGATINSPAIAVKNAERLTVEIMDNNLGNTTASLKLIIKGEKSNAMKAIDVGTAELNKRIVEIGASDKPFVIVLDAATPDQKTGEDLRFSKLDADTTEKFI
ncbi:MAG: type II secretion system protein, partial [Clostridia bacterium]|nr:type II secretion system protein [Clostridia bacterium]